MEMLDFDFLKNADEITLRLEKAKKALENAKIELENSKIAYEELFSQADKHGFNKAKLKKLTEDRVHALMDSFSADNKTEKNKKTKKSKESSKNQDEITDDFIDADGEHEQGANPIFS
jgi:hypothetical protein